MKRKSKSRKLAFKSRCRSFKKNCQKSKYKKSGCKSQRPRSMRLRCKQHFKSKRKSRSKRKYSKKIPEPPSIPMIKDKSLEISPLLSDKRPIIEAKSLGEMRDKLKKINTVKNINKDLKQLINDAKSKLNKVDTQTFVKKEDQFLKQIQDAKANLKRTPEALQRRNELKSRLKRGANMATFRKIVNKTKDKIQKGEALQRRKDIKSKFKKAVSMNTFRKLMNETKDKLQKAEINNPGLTKQIENVIEKIDNIEDNPEKLQALIPFVENKIDNIQEKINQLETTEKAKIDCARCAVLLKSYKITNKKEFRKWLLINHPDKGGEEDIFKNISNCLSFFEDCIDDINKLIEEPEVQEKLAENLNTSPEIIEQIVNIPETKDILVDAIIENPQQIINVNQQIDCNYCNQLFQNKNISTLDLLNQWLISNIEDGDYANITKCSSKFRDRECNPPFDFRKLPFNPQMLSQQMGVLKKTSLPKKSSRNLPFNPQMLSQQMSVLKKTPPLNKNIPPSSTLNNLIRQGASRIRNAVETEDDDNNNFD